MCTDPRTNAEICGTAECGTALDYCDVERSCGTCTDPFFCETGICRLENVVPGLQSITSNGVARHYYLQLPSDYDPATPDKPLVVGYHGTDGHYSY